MTLALACVFAAAWMRSYLVIETLRLGGFRRIELSKGGIEYWRGLTWQDNIAFSEKQSDTPDEEFNHVPDLNAVAIRGPLPDIRIWSIPCWTTVLPLTLLSAYLLLSRSRLTKNARALLQAEPDHA